MPTPDKHPIIKIYVISGGVGASGEQLVNTVLAQFPSQNVIVENKRHVQTTLQIQYILLQAQKEKAFLVHTMVDTRLRSYLINEAKKKDISTVDLMGDLIEWLSNNLNQQPLQEPGRYRKLQREYFDRMDAIHYSIAQDDGKNPAGWPQADIVLLGVSRSGKTPLSMYLAVLGWKVANIPLIPQLPIPKSIFELDVRRAIGLTINPAQLHIYRSHRLARMGIHYKSDYNDYEKITDEISFALQIFHRGGFKVIDVTDKTIELCADEIIKHLSTYNLA
jgi:[pyruvate, water dikinase]-phosphate phosphotransferase / [pyruvate, water dikinase] kinase